MPEPDWQRSSYCAEGSSCVYVAPGERGQVLIAESPRPGTVLTASTAAWAAFLGAVLSGGAT
ncbi:DUF397 domain-containing protein [Streptomyces sp. NPDC002033]|uniref:DUF397 domain-containing protein n=1 Tax=unclassified Streptomyces TaxID=2593676 RepID=UPI00331EC24B